LFEPLFVLLLLFAELSSRTLFFDVIVKCCFVAIPSKNALNNRAAIFAKAIFGIRYRAVGEPVLAIFFFRLARPAAAVSEKNVV